MAWTSPHVLFMGPFVGNCMATRVRECLGPGTERLIRYDDTRRANVLLQRKFLGALH